MAKYDSAIINKVSWTLIGNLQMKAPASHYPHILIKYRTVVSTLTHGEDFWLGPVIQIQIVFDVLLFKLEVLAPLGFLL